VVLIDQATEDFAPLDWQVQRSASWWVSLIGRSLLAGLVWPVPVVMAGVLAEDRPEVSSAVDQHPVGEFAPGGVREAFRAGVGSHRQ
jgi:hypothetical protein